MSFIPIIAYLFNEWKCNLDCHYCWAFDNSVRGMTEDVAKRSVDWLHDTGCRVLALMGGEPLLRPDFAHKIIYYAAKKDFWIYLPTNGRLLRPDVIDKVADAGVAYSEPCGRCLGRCQAWTAEGDGADPRPISITWLRSSTSTVTRSSSTSTSAHNNMDDVRQLTELAHDNGIATDYHICESPMTEQPHFKHLYIESDVHPRGRSCHGGRAGRLADGEAEVGLSHGELEWSGWRR